MDKRPPPKQEEMTTDPIEDEIPQPSFCCTEHFPDTNRFCRTHVCTQCRCCCASWEKVMNTILRRMARHKKRTVDIYEDKMKKCQEREADYSIRLTKQEAALIGLITEGEASEEFIKAQGINVAVAARNLRQAQKRTRDARLYFEFFQSDLDDLDAAIHTEDFVNTTLPFNQLLKKYRFGEKVIEQDKAGKLVNDPGNAMNNIRETVTRIHKVVEEKRKAADAKSAADSISGEVLDVNKYMKALEIKCKLPKNFLNPGMVAVAKNKKRMGIDETGGKFTVDNDDNDTKSIEPTQVRQTPADLNKDDEPVELDPVRQDDDPEDMYEEEKESIEMIAAVDGLAQAALSEPQPVQEPVTLAEQMIATTGSVGNEFSKPAQNSKAEGSPPRTSSA